MAVTSRLTCFGQKLRIRCFIIGYLILLASVVDIACHVISVAIVTGGFQCEIDAESLRAVNIPWLEPVLVMLNLGTHGFYPFPRSFRNPYDIYAEYQSFADEPQCYPGMLHVSILDVLNFLINVIWLRIVTSYVTALHKKNPEPMRMFLSMSIIKLIMQVMYFGYQPIFPDVFTVESYCFKILDIFISITFLITVKSYMVALRAEKSTPVADQPPPYIECLINNGVAQTDKEVNKDDVVIPVEEKKPANETEP